MQMHTPGPDLRIAKQDRRDITKYRYSTNRTNSTDRTNSNWTDSTNKTNSTNRTREGWGLSWGRRIGIEGVGG